MKAIKLILLYLCIAIVLFGCSNETIQQKPISIKTTEIISLVNQSEWEKAKLDAKQLKTIYDENKWKYQLLGDENEYDTLAQQIKKLMISIEEKDKKEAKYNLAMIEHYLKSLYLK